MILYIILLSINRKKRIQHADGLLVKVAATTLHTTMLTRCLCLVEVCKAFKPKTVFLAGVGEKWRTTKFLLEKFPITQHIRCTYVCI